MLSSTIANSQSYLIGIETVAVAGRAAEGILSIVPYWNWNQQTKHNGRGCLNSQSYLIGIETQSGLWHLHTRGLSIVPYWNWNSKEGQGRVVDSMLSIVPYWNWNEGGGGGADYAWDSQSYLIGIETIPPIQRCLIFLFSQSYLIGIETRNGEYTSQDNILSIVPYWNWNCKRERYWLRNEDSQSYLIGIETYPLAQ